MTDQTRPEPTPVKLSYQVRELEQQVSDAVYERDRAQEGARHWRHRALTSEAVARGALADAKQRAEKAEAALGRVHHDAVRAITAWHSARQRAKLTGSKLDASRELADLYRQKIRNLKADLLDVEERGEQAETALAHLQQTSKAAGILLTRTTDEREQAETEYRAAVEAAHTAADRADKAEEQLAAAEDEVKRLGLMVDEYSQGARTLSEKLRRAEAALDRIRDAASLHRKGLIGAELYAVIEAHTTPAPAASGAPPTEPCTDPRHTGRIREQLGCVGPDPAATEAEIIARRSGRHLWCLEHSTPQWQPLVTDWEQLTSEDLPDGGTCRHCGVDVLIPQQPAPAATEATEDALRYVQVVISGTDEFTTNRSALCIADHLRAEFADSIAMDITTDAHEMTDSATRAAVAINTGGPFVEYVPGPPAPVVVTDREAIRAALDEPDPRPEAVEQRCGTAPHDPHTWGHTWNGRHYLCPGVPAEDRP